MSFTMKTLTEGIRQRHMGAQHDRLTEKWNRTGLLRGLTGYNRENMSVMLENQAAQLLRESSSLGTSAGGAGDIRGFQNVAFPIVRRVFGGLIANDLVSIQPMSLPSGLLFYLDYTYGSDVGGAEAGGATGPDDTLNEADAMLYQAGRSIYNNPTGKGVRSGSLGVGGQYDLLGSGYSRRHGLSSALGNATGETDAVAATATIMAGTSAKFGDSIGIIDIAASTGIASTVDFNAGSSNAVTVLTGAIGRLVDFDADLQVAINNGDINGLVFFTVPTGSITDGAHGSSWGADFTMVQDFGLVSIKAGTYNGVTDTVTPIPNTIQGGKNLLNIRRHNKLVDFSSTGVVSVNPLGGSHLLMVAAAEASTGIWSWTGGDTDDFQVSFPLSPVLDSSNADALTIPTFESSMSDNDPSASPIIPEIDIKIESLAVTAVTRKLKAKWSPELAQDLNAYHSLDAEVELTQILSEQIALEIDREVLNDLLTQANGSNLFWSRAPGKFVNKLTGVEVPRNTSLRPGPQFTGTVRDWYETLVETVIDCANQIHRKTLRGSANFMVIGPDVATILEASVMYKPSYSLDGEGQVSAMSIGAEKVGTLSNRFSVYKDPYFPRNKVLIGYKGGSYLETGYVYAPYVPLIVTPTIFAPEDFTPRKGVMTRYGKKMVRSDFYGTVTLMDMNII